MGVPVAIWGRCGERCGEKEDKVVLQSALVGNSCLDIKRSLTLGIHLLLNDIFRCQRSLTTWVRPKAKVRQRGKQDPIKVSSYGNSKLKYQASPSPSIHSLHSEI